MTYGEAISRVTNGLNSITKDSRIPKRYILSVLKETGAFLLSQKMREKTLYRETDLFRWLTCVELEPDEIVTCPIVSFRRCSSIMKTKKKLPNIIGSRFGYAILVVRTIDGNKEFKPITIQDYNVNKSRPNNSKFLGRNYYILDGRLYIPDSDVEVIDMLVLTLDEDYEDISSCGNIDECKSPWDVEMNFPDRFTNVIIQETIKEVSLRLNIPKDENSNLDANQKTQTIQ